MYKNWGKFNQRIRQRGGTLTNPFPKPKSGRVRRKKKATPQDAPTNRQVREWERYVADCRARNTLPQNIPPAIRRILVERNIL